jgi:hypothetical protein
VDHAFGDVDGVAVRGRARGFGDAALVNADIDTSVARLISFGDIWPGVSTPPMTRSALFTASASKPAMNRAAGYFARRGGNR